MSRTPRKVRNAPIAAVVFFQALVMAPVIVIFDEPAEAGFMIAMQAVIFQQDAILEGPFSIDTSNAIRFVCS